MSLPVRRPRLLRLRRALEKNYPTDLCQHGLVHVGGPAVPRATSLRLHFITAPSLVGLQPRTQEDVDGRGIPLPREARRRRVGHLG